MQHSSRTWGSAEVSFDPSTSITIMLLYHKGCSLRKTVLLLFWRYLTLKMHPKMSSVCRLLHILANISNLFCLVANSVDPDQTAPRGEVWSGSTLFAKMTFEITRRQSRRQLLWLAVYGLKDFSWVLLKIISFWLRRWIISEQTVYTQTRRHRTRRLIRVYAVCYSTSRFFVAFPGSQMDKSGSRKA